MDLLLAPDTGLMHLAAHLGTPVLAFFLASAWAWETGPYGMGHKVWQSVPPCAPCLESRPCPHRQVCLEPFKSAAWIARLRGRPGETAIQAPLLLSSSLDALGLTFTPSLQDAVWEKTAEGDERHARRALLAEYLGVESFDRKSPIPAELSSELLEEKDWMLPEYGAV
jgi:hypothetical protein